jgi:replicative DNA helicase
LKLEEYAVPKTSGEATDILNLWLDETRLICHEDVTTLKDLKAKHYQAKAKGFVSDIIFVDQITRFSDDSKQHGNRNLELEFINNSLEKLIKKEDVAICEVVQINREIEREAYPMPSMANLKDSGSFEQNASVVITFLRPKYYADQPKWSNKKEFISRMEENSIQYGCPDDGAGLILFNFVKNRYGEPGIIPMRFNLPGTRITSWKKNAMNYKMGFDEV